MWARDAPARLLYGSNAFGKWELYAWDRSTDSHRQITDRPEGTWAGRIDPRGERIWWFDDRRGDEFGRWNVEPYGGVDGASPAAPTLRPGYGAGIALGTFVAVIGLSTAEEGSSIYAVDPEGEASLLYRHREDAHVGGLSRDDDLVSIGHSEHGDSRHPAVRVLSLEGEAVAELWDGPGRGLWPGGWSRVPGDRRLLVVHERRDLPRPLLWWPDTGETQELDVALPGEVDASWYPDGRALLLRHDHRGRSDLHRLDLGTGELRRLEVERGTVLDARVRPDGEVWYALTRSSSGPEVRGSAGLLLRPDGDPPPPGVPYADVFVGDVHVFVAEPAGSRPHPTIFVVHGGPEAHDRDAFSPHVQALVDHGLAVVLVNYRGSTGYGKAWRDAITGNPGLTELEDLAKVHDRLVAAGVVDPARVAISGTSWGGYLTLLALGRQPERWALGVAGVPVADYVAAYEQEMEPLKCYDRALFGGSPEDIPDAYRERSPIEYVEDVRVPVLILAGENDPRCPIGQIDNYLARLRELGKAHEVYRYDAGHGSLVIEESIRQVEAELSFCARYLGTEPPT